MQNISRDERGLVFYPELAVMLAHKFLCLNASMVLSQMVTQQELGGSVDIAQSVS
jgi:hypothetical protein